MTFLLLPLEFMLPSLFILGAIVGSFLNVCVYRLPRYESVWAAWKYLVYPPSRCGSCFRTLRAHDNIPVFGWFLLGGKCRYCKTPYSIRYPVIEALNGLLFVLVYLAEIPAGISLFERAGLFHSLGPISPRDLDASILLHWRYFYHMLLIEVLLVASLIDFDLMIIPDSVTVPGFIFAFLGALLIGPVHLVPVWYQDSRSVALFESALRMLAGYPIDLSAQVLPNPVGPWVYAWPRLHALGACLMGALVGAGSVYWVRAVGAWAMKQEVMGFGDVILMGVIGAFLGWQPALLIFCGLAPLAALLATPLFRCMNSKGEIPFGPYLSLGALLLILFWPFVWPPADSFFALGWFAPATLFLMGLLLALLLRVVYLIKRAMGWGADELEWIEEWTPGDQLAFLASQKGGRWPVAEWPGVHSGQGQLRSYDWRTPGVNSRPISSWKR